MEYVNCNFCGEDECEPVNQGPDLLLDRPGAYHLVRCTHCDLIYQNPRLTLDELPAQYPETYVPYKKDVQEVASLSQRLSDAHALQRRCSQVSKRLPDPGRLLDVGCATGIFLNAMQERGWQTKGVELSGYASEYARQTFGLDVYTGTLEDAAFPEHAFDLVTMFDVLEHVIDPKKTLAEIQRVLKPGGMLVLTLPNPTCVEARLFGDTWVGWDRPRHLHIFTPEVLRRYVRVAGMEVVEFDSLGGRLALTLMSLEFFLTKHNVSEKARRLALRYLYIWPLRLFTWPFYRIAERLNKSTNMTVFIRSPK